jgi:glutamate-5-semialdehyde dehydrogenase
MTESRNSLESQLLQVRRASQQLQALEASERTGALQRLAQLLHAERLPILAANQADLDSNPQLSPALRQRLSLDASKLESLIQGVEQVARLADPVGQVIERMQLAPGLVRSKLRVPLGVVAVIFESRPDVLPQILALMLRSGNAVVFKGGSEAAHSITAFMRVIELLQRESPSLPANWALALHSREEIAELLRYDTLIDLVIPRGSNQLVRSVMQATKIPVLGHADGICHTYLHSNADQSQALAVILDAKTDYPSGCNATETLLVHRSRAQQFLPPLAQRLGELGGKVRGCQETNSILPAAELIADDQWSTEYSNLTLAIKVVESLEAAVEHINRYGSKHTDAILCDPLDRAAQDYFTRMVDSAGVYVNCSTRFADGYVYGYGAEVGISTSKIHARGPAGISALLSTKDILVGSGPQPLLRGDFRGPQAKAFSHTVLALE